MKLRACSASYIRYEGYYYWWLKKKVTNLFLKVVDTIGEYRSVHTKLVVWLTITISVPVKAAVTDVVLHAPLPVLHQLLHLDQVDSGGVAWAVAPPY